MAEEQLKTPQLEKVVVSLVGHSGLILVVNDHSSMSLLRLGSAAIVDPQVLIINLALRSYHPRA